MPVVVVSPEPIRGLILCLLYSFKNVLIEPFVADRAIVALDVGVLLRLVVPAKALHVAQRQETQAETPGPAIGRQTRKTRAVSPSVEARTCARNNGALIC